MAVPSRPCIATPLAFTYSCYIPYSILMKYTCSEYKSCIILLLLVYTTWGTSWGIRNNC